ncbi:MAG TPA: cation diffusion facilitator family transporter [Anaerolineales bacterium]|nr:cation diffusion facilitator family transporter [Anaerolineales bacterium]
MLSHNKIHPNLTRFAWLSITAAILTIGIKAIAYLITGSVGLFSDALEGGVNLVGALMQLFVLKVAAQPADDEHMYGHTKAEYFSSGAEGFLILSAAIVIGFEAIKRLLVPEPIDQVMEGLSVSLIASLINLTAARVLLKNGQKYQSIALSAGGQHLMTDVYTSAGVIFGVGLVALTGWYWLDPVIALMVAANILFTGYRILHESIEGLMDHSIPPEKQEILSRIISRHRENGIEIHEVRTRQAGAQSYIRFHILVPGDWTVQHGHQLCDAVELEIQSAIPNSHVDTHLESLDDPRSWM